VADRLGATATRADWLEGRVGARSSWKGGQQGKTTGRRKRRREERGNKREW
jgi:hypothetical protein